MGMAVKSRQFASNFIYNYAMLPGAVFYIAGMILLIATPAVLIWRINVFLREGRWLGSLCEVTTDLTPLGLGVIPDACFPIVTGWVGVDRMFAWALLQADASLIMLGTLAVVVVCLVFCALFATRVTSGLRP